MNFLVLSGWGFSPDIMLPFLKALEGLLNNSSQDAHIKLVKHNKYGMNLKSTAEQLLKHVDDDTILIGWSLGGLIARAATYYFSEHHARKIKACIILCSSPCFIAKDNWPGVDRKYFDGFYAKICDSGIDDLKKEFSYLCAMGGPSPKQWIRSISPYFLSSAQYYEQNKRGLAILSTDFRLEAKNITIPSLDIYADNDQLVPQYDLLGCDLSNLLSSNSKIINNSGHLLPLTHTDECIDLMKNFLVLNNFFK